MLVEIASALAGLKAASELGSLMLKIKVDSAVADKIKETQFAIGSAQSAMIEANSKYQELLDERDSLKKQLIDIEKWDAEAVKYELTEISPSVFAYAKKPDPTTTTPAHWLCQNCYEDRRKSILQRTMNIGIGVAYICPHCQATLIVN